MRRPLLPVAGAVLLFLVACTPGAPEAEAPEAPVAVPLTPDFDLTADELALFAADLADSLPAEAILVRPAEFLILMRGVLEEDSQLFLIADKENALPADYRPDDLVSLNEFDLALNRGDLSLSRSVMPDLLAMDQAAKNEGLRLVYSSSFRSYEYQNEVYARNVAQLGEEAASRVSARPGTSQHQLGTTVDFGSITDAFAATPEGRWLEEHAWEYGFSLSYPKGYEEETGYVWESWHYRYIGRPAARMEKLYFDGLQHRLLAFLETYRDFFEERYLK